MRQFVLASPALLLLVGAGAPPHGVLTIDVGNVRIAKGNVHVDVCPEAQFLKDNCPWAGNARARLGDTRVTVTNLPAGRYAVQAFLDENGNGEVDRALFGIPRKASAFPTMPRSGSARQNSPRRRSLSMVTPALSV